MSREDLREACVHSGVESRRLSGWTRAHTAEDRPAPRCHWRSASRTISKQKPWRSEGAAPVTHPATLGTVLIIHPYHYLSGFLTLFLVRTNAADRQTEKHTNKHKPTYTDRRAEVTDVCVLFWCLSHRRKMKGVQWKQRAACCILLIVFLTRVTCWLPLDTLKIPYECLGSRGSNLYAYVMVNNWMQMMRGIVFTAESEFSVFSEDNAHVLQVCSSLAYTSSPLFSSWERKQRCLWRRTNLIRNIISGKEYPTFSCVWLLMVSVILHYFFSSIYSHSFSLPRQKTYTKLINLLIGLFVHSLTSCREIMKMCTQQDMS